MMKDSEIVNMFLNIGDQRISLSVPFERQDFVRNVEAKVEQLYRRWRKAFQSKTDKEIMAMVAYQFASHYSELKERYDDATKMAADCLSHIDNPVED